MHRGRGRAAPVAAMALTAVLAGACGDGSGAALDLPRADQQYDGPLYVETGRYGAAGGVLGCRHRPAAGGFESSEVYAEGATSDSVAKALATARSEGMFLDLPDVDLEVAKTESDRVLLTYSADDAVRAAVIFRDGPATEGAGGDGWYRESWARCDFSEFPEEVAESYFGYQIWTGPDGEPALTTDIVSYPGPEHCDWQSMTFLSLGEKRTYVRHPPAELGQWVDGAFVPSMELPADAVDTGFRRDGRRLWLSPPGDRAYVGRPGDVEAWPKAHLACA
ncbi:MAG: hypothetical protein M3237_24105 [Actinomycetota bacterium]|nr:hypothetical protein [Actinomycetota bacterium]